MEEKVIGFLRGKAGGFRRFFNSAANSPHRKGVNFAALHQKPWLSGVRFRIRTASGSQRGCKTKIAMCRDLQEMQRIPFSQNHSGGSVSKQNTGAAIRPVQNPAQPFRGKHQNISGFLSGKDAFRDVQRIEKAAARTIHIHSGTSGSQFHLHYTGQAGRHVIAAKRGTNDVVQIRGRNPTVIQRVPGRGHRNFRDGFCGENGPLFDSRSCCNPLIAGIHQLRKVLVRFSAGR